MPLPMVHLAISVEMHHLQGTEPLPDFLLGSIAPDAIHMRTDTGRDDKRRVHLSEVDDPQHERARSLWIQSQSDGFALAEFARGYVAHILTDRLWTETMGATFRQSIPPGLSPQERRSLYYLETDQIDFDLYHQMPWRPAVWVQLTAAQPMDFASLLTADEIAKWRDRTLNWFEKLKPEPMITPVYITGGEVQRFINQTAEKILATFESWGC